MVKSGWNEEEESKVAAAFVSPKQRGTGNWSTSSKRSGQRRNGKLCREKSSISNQKQTDPKTNIFTPQEEELVIQLHAAIGSRWPIIAMQMPGKTESDVKVLWNSKLKKKLSAMGIDPVTHKPFSQILADYGNMGAFSKARTRLGSLSRDLKTAFVFKQDEVVVEAEGVKSEVYSQMEVISLVAEASKSEYESSSPSSREAASSSFSWSDFFLEEAFAAEQGEGRVMQQFDEEVMDVKGLVVEEGGAGNGGGGGGVDATSSSSSSSSFVEAMIGKQEEMCSQSQLPCFYEEPFYY